MNLWDKICDRDYCQDLLASIVHYAVLIGLIYSFWSIGKLLYLYWEPDWETLFDYLDVKLPSVIIGTLGLMLSAWIYDILTPGSFQEKIASEPMSSAVFMGAYVLGLAMILAR